MRIAVIDVGGTNIKHGIFEDDKILEYQETPTEAKLGGEHVMETILQILSGYHELEAIGISTAGQVDMATGSIRYANENIPGYTGMQIKERVEMQFHIPTMVDNDVNSAAYGEAVFGAGRGHQDFLCLTYGTGVGGAVLLNGKIYYGSSFIAGEFGGILTHPEERKGMEDPYAGCYEKYASTTALVQSIQKEFPSITNGREIFSRIEEQRIKELVDKWLDEVVYGLVSLIHILNPSLIVLGGGVMEQEIILKEIQKKLEEQLIPSFQGTRVVQAELGNKAGLLGAAQNALDNQKR